MEITMALLFYCDEYLTETASRIRKKVGRWTWFSLVFKELIGSLLFANCCERFLRNCQNYVSKTYKKKKKKTGSEKWMVGCFFYL